MKDLVTRIRKGRQKGDLRRRLKFYRKSNKEYDEILSIYEKNKKTMRSNGRWMVVGFVLAVATIGYNIYKVMDYSYFYKKAMTELESMQVNAEEAQDNAMTAIKNSKVYDAMGITLLDSALGDSERKDGFHDLAERHLKLVQEFVSVTGGKWPEVYKDKYEKVKGELDL